MDHHDLMQSYRNDQRQFAAFILSLDDESATGWAATLKDCIDQYTRQDLAQARLYIAGLAELGRLRTAPGLIALSLLARANFEKEHGSLDQAYEYIQAAAGLYRAAGDAHGWARTRITLLPIALRRRGDGVAAARHDADEALAIFSDPDTPINQEMRRRLHVNLGDVASHVRDYSEALEHYRLALELARRLDLADRQALTQLNIGNVYMLQGLFERARATYDQALELARRHGELSVEIRVLCNVGEMELLHGRPIEALSALGQAIDLAEHHQFDSDIAAAQQFMVAAHLMLSQHRRARDLALQVIERWRERQDRINEALSLIELARAEIALETLESAAGHLEEARQIFGEQQIGHGLGLVSLLAATIALRQAAPAATRQAEGAAAIFARSRSVIHYAEACYVLGQAAAAAGQSSRAFKAFRSAFRLAEKRFVPELAYKAAVALGDLAGDGTAREWYLAAETIVDMMQRRLTHTMRPGFLQQKNASMHALMTGYLGEGRAGAAWELLEQRKALATLSYLAHPDQLRWPPPTHQSRALIAEQAMLLQRYHALTEQHHSGSGGRPPEGLDAKLREYAWRLEAINQRLPLLAYQPAAQHAINPPGLAAVQASLDPTTLLVSFYNDGRRLWALCLDAEKITGHDLGPAGRINPQRLRKLIDGARALDPFAEGHRARLRQRLDLTRQALGDLHAALIAPLAERLAGRTRVVIAPYGDLHYLPFHLFWDGEHYLIEDLEVSYLPCASLAMRRGPRARPGVLALAHTQGARLPNRAREAAEVCALFAGEAYIDDEARSVLLEREPTQILHIAAHGKFFPTAINAGLLSFIEIGDGKLNADQALQFNLGYELVTLSACETGCADVVPGDELMGLWRGFFYAGAGALLVSQWQVPDTDEFTPTLMRRFYAALRAGQSKAAALRSACRQQLAEHPELHPAFWGAFQLIGDPAPLSHL